jgi:hypothetical protein
LRLPARIQRCTVPPANSANPPPPTTPANPARDSENPPLPPDLHPPPRPWPGLDRLAALQATGGLVLGLIALFSSYDHLTLAGYRIAIQQQWGIPCILASVATVFIDAELATRARDRAAHEADRERYRANRERNRAAQARKRQDAALDLLRRSAVLSARVQLEPSATNRQRLQAFLALIAPQPDQQGDG